MITIGIDPGTAETGYGIIDSENGKLKLLAHGNIKTSVDHDSSKRLFQIYTQVCGLCHKYRPNVLAIESLFFFANAKSVIAVSQAIGVIKLAAATENIKVLDYPPLKIKMNLTGNGRAEKKDIQKTVRKILRLKKVPRPTHAADALAVALCHLRQKGGD